jgi:NAD(P)H dehydrogenase (quinone)
LTGGVVFVWLTLINKPFLGVVLMVSVVVAYHSGYGHTAKVAEAVVRGAAGVAGIDAVLVNVDEIDQHWDQLDNADAIVFGAPTYMGGPSAQFKTFIDKASGRWFKQQWKDKIAGGFTNSGSYSGDKQTTLLALLVNALQHSMIWVGTGLMPASSGSVEGPGIDAINRLGSSTGVMTQAGNVAADQAPPSGDIKTAELYGQRIAEVTKQYLAGKKAA